MWEKDELLQYVSHLSIILTDAGGLLKSESPGSHLAWWRGPWRRIQKAQVSDLWLCIQEERDGGGMGEEASPLSFYIFTLQLNNAGQNNICWWHDYLYKEKWWELYQKASVISEFSSGTEYKVDIWKSIVFLMKHQKLK